jgi:hypothetical protein
LALAIDITLEAFNSLGIHAAATANLLYHVTTRCYSARQFLRLQLVAYTGTLAETILVCTHDLHGFGAGGDVTEVCIRAADDPRVVTRQHKANASSPTMEDLSGDVGRKRVNDLAIAVMYNSNTSNITVSV